MTLEGPFQPKLIFDESSKDPMVESRGGGTTDEDFSVCCTAWWTSQLWSLLYLTGPALSKLEEVPDLLGLYPCKRTSPDL